MTVSIRVFRRPSVLVLGFLAASAFAACGAEGEGTIKLDNPAAIRAKAGGGGGVGGEASGKETAKQAKAKSAEEEAAKKHPKLN